MCLEEGGIETMNARRILGGAVALTLLVTGIAAAQSTKPRKVTLIDSVTIASSDEQPLVRLSGVAVLPSRALVLSDISEGNVRIHAPDGSLKRVVGRRGEGPLEFRAPAWPRVDRLGRIHIIDLSLKRVTVISLRAQTYEPTLVRTVSFSRALTAVSGFAIARDGSYLFTGQKAGAREVLFHVDSLGELINAALPILQLRRPSPVGTEDAIWRAVTSTAIASDGDQVFLTLSTFDSVWVTRDLKTFRATKLPYLRYQVPTLPSVPFRSRDEIKAWAEGLVGVTAISDSGRAFFPAFRGTYLEGAEAETAVFERGKWTVLESLPSIVATKDQFIYTLRSIEEPIRLIRWRLR